MATLRSRPLIENSLMLTPFPTVVALGTIDSNLIKPRSGLCSFDATDEPLFIVRPLAFGQSQTI